MRNNQVKLGSGLLFLVLGGFWIPTAYAVLLLTVLWLYAWNTKQKGGINETRIVANTVNNDAPCCIELLC